MNTQQMPTVRTEFCAKHRVESRFGATCHLCMADWERGNVAAALSRERWEAQANGREVPSVFTELPAVPLAIHDEIGEPEEGGPVVAVFWTVYLLALALVGWAIGYALGLWKYPL